MQSISYTADKETEISLSLVLCFQFRFNPRVRMYISSPCFKKTKTCVQYFKLSFQMEKNNKIQFLLLKVDYNLQ